MFCEKCGAKAKAGAKFCEECGERLKKPVKKTNKKRKPISKKNKIIIGIISILILMLVIFFIVCSSIYKPKTIAVNYFEAVIDNDYDALYDYFDVDNKDFTSKKVFKELVKEDEASNEVVNYRVTNSSVSADGLSATVTIKYVTNDSDNETATINLVKDKKNKMLFFSNWKINNANLETIKNYEVKALKDSEVEIAGIKLDDYKDDEKSDDEFDVYVLPEVFALEYPVKITYPMGVTIDTSIEPSTYYNGSTLELDVDDISDDTKNQIESAILSNIQVIYDAAKDNNDFSNIRSNFEYENGDLTELEASYNDFKEDLNGRSTKLTEIKFSEVEISDININDDGTLEVDFSADYDYKATYELFGETETSEDDGTTYSSMTFAYKDGYKLTDFDDFKYYFY